MLFRAKLVVVGLGEVAVAIALWRRGPVDDPLRWSDPLGWLRATTVENALAEVGRVVVLVVVGWMVFATALAIVARVLDVVFGTRRCFGAISRVLPGFVVTMVAAAIVTAGPVVAQTRTPVTPLGPVRDGRAPTSAATAAPVPGPPTIPGTAPSTTAAPLPPPTAATVARNTPPAPDTPAAPATPPPIAAHPIAGATTPLHVVAAGESLWSIARDRVGDDAAALDRYWRALCDANRGRLPSGDVNLIRPGDTIVLPESG